MRTILVPTDLSDAANNALEYAAKIALAINGKLLIANIKLATDAEVTAEPLNCRYIRTTTDILRDISESTQKTFSVPCNFVEKSTKQNLQKAIAKLSAETDLIVMGTNGTDDTYQYFFGTNTYQVIKKTKCPVFVIPEAVSYKSIQKIVFAWDYTRDNKAAFLQMNNLLEGFSYDIIFLHISHQKTIISDDVFDALKEEVCSSLNDVGNIQFKRIFSEEPENFSDKLHEFMEDSNADLLAITYYDRGIIPNLFHGNITRKLTEAVTYPLLVLHE
mgnify:CR=1 FL=1